MGSTFRTALADKLDADEEAKAAARFFLCISSSFTCFSRSFSYFSCSFARIFSRSFAFLICDFVIPAYGSPLFSSTCVPADDVAGVPALSSSCFSSLIDTPESASINCFFAMSSDPTEVKDSLGDRDPDLDFFMDISCDVFSACFCASSSSSSSSSCCCCSCFLSSKASAYFCCLSSFFFSTDVVNGGVSNVNTFFSFSAFFVLEGVAFGDV